MQANILRIQILRPIEKVFEFATDPKKTHLWIDSIKRETRNSGQVQKGTEYTNDSGIYVVSAYEKDSLFELSKKGSSYVVRYTFLPNEYEKQTELTYAEWMQNGSQLESPLTIEALNKFKEQVEKDV